MLPIGTSFSKSWQALTYEFAPRGDDGRAPSWKTDAPPRARTFNIPRNKDTSKVTKILDAIDVAAKYFVYKLYDATLQDRTQWVPLEAIDESQAAIERAVKCN
jgi:phosphoribosylformylglycinamidine (FGAM) synthase-like enzyme